MASIPTLLSYPASLGKDVAQGQHYLLIDSYESSSAVDKEGSGTRKSSIALYIPPGSMQTTLGQRYESLTGGARLAALGAGGNTSDLLIDSLTSAITKPKLVDDFRAAGLGMARNAHIAAVYRGPADFRTHSFTFDFWPKSPPESNMVDKIIKDFKAGSTPRMGATFKSSGVNKLTAPYFHSPRQWEIKFCKGNTIEADRQAAAVTGAGGTNPYIFQIHRSVITTMTINHDPDGVVGFHTDGSPVHSRLSITFQEMQFVTSSDTVSEEANATASEISAQDRKSASLAATGGAGSQQNSPGNPASK